VTRFERVHEGLDTAPMLEEIAAHPGLWDLYTERRTTPGSPHAEMEDIWIRTRARHDLADPDAFRLPYVPIFYPAWRVLPSIQPVVWALVAMAKAVQLGNILLTRLPPGARIETHTDRGWSVDWFASKFYVVLSGNDACTNTCEDETVVMRTGDIWRFENRLPHSVDNRGDTDRISLIVTMRVET